MATLYASWATYPLDGSPCRLYYYGHLSHCRECAGMAPRAGVGQLWRCYHRHDSREEAVACAEAHSKTMNGGA
jgi:hypothetical protein